MLVCKASRGGGCPNLEHKCLEFVQTLPGIGVGYKES